MSSHYRKDFPVSWAELHRDARALSWRLLEMQEWKGIVAVSRGGLVPAAIVARELDLRLVETACIVSYHSHGGGEAQHQSEPQILKGVNLDDLNDGEGLVIVDDLVDTGRTLKVLREMLPKAHVATVYAKPEGRPLVDTFITEVSQNTWIRFPWDMEFSFAEPLADKRRGE